MKTGLLILILLSNICFAESSTISLTENQNNYLEEQVNKLIDSSTEELHELTEAIYTRGYIRKNLILSIQEFGINKGLIQPLEFLSSELKKLNRHNLAKKFTRPIENFKTELEFEFNLNSRNDETRPISSKIYDFPYSFDQQDDYEAEYQEGDDERVIPHHDPTIQNSSDNIYECFKNCAGTNGVVGGVALAFAPNPIAATAIVITTAVTCSVSCIPKKDDSNNNGDDSDGDDDCNRENCNSSDDSRIAFNPDSPGEGYDHPEINFDFELNETKLDAYDFNDIRFVNFGNPLLQGMR